MLIEKLPEVQSLPVEEKWRLIDELWQNLAQQVEGAAPDTNVIAFLENRFADYLADPSQARWASRHASCGSGRTRSCSSS